MTIKRLLILQLVLCVGFGAVFFLPKVANSSPQGIELVLPAYVGRWFGEDQKISEQERTVLAKDTEFARKLYTDGNGGQIFASIVLSGQDLNNSIHRPERCLPAQGWSVADSRVVKLPDANRQMEITRLHNVRKVPTPDGQTVSIYSLNYYWFIGWKETTASNIGRTYIDMRDRLVYGCNQRWAYVTVASTITKGLVPFGKDEAQTDEMVQSFIEELLPFVKKSPTVAKN